MHCFHKLEFDANSFAFKYMSSTLEGSTSDVSVNISYLLFCNFDLILTTDLACLAEFFLYMY